MSDGAVSFLLEHLRQILKYNDHLVAVKESVQSLCQELTILQSLMKYHAKKNHGSDFLANEIRTMVDEAEDAVDTYLLQAAFQRSNPLFEMGFHFIGFPKKLRDVGIQIERLSAKIKAEDGIGIPKFLCQPVLPKPAPNIEEENVVGFEDAVAEVSKLLTQGPEQFATVSIVGMLGLGKTTLAEAMELMYKQLPEYLKPCFIYLGIFKVDAKIPVWKLLRLWIAEGLIHEVRDINLEDMAEHYLEELVYRNLVMVVERRSNGRIKFCRMHDTICYFCKYVGSAENMLEEVTENTMETFQSETPVISLP